GPGCDAQSDHERIASAVEHDVDRSCERLRHRDTPAVKRIRSSCPCRARGRSPRYICRAGTNPERAYRRLSVAAQRSGDGGVFVPGVPVDRYYLSLRCSGEPGAYGYHGSSAGPATVIQFSQPDPQGLDAMQEDLNVMSLLLQRKLEDAVGENSPAYKMGIPLLLRSGQRGIESLYLDGFGALFTVNVNFPLVPPPVNKAKENEDTTGS